MGSDLATTADLLMRGSCGSVSKHKMNIEQHMKTSHPDQGFSVKQVTEIETFPDVCACSHVLA